MRYTVMILGVALIASGCATTKPQAAADLNGALNIAAAAEAAYAGSRTANPQTVARLAQLLSSAQAALFSWQASTSPADQAVASAAIAALFAYEAGAPKG